MTETMKAKVQIKRLVARKGFTKLIDIIEATDMPAEIFAEAIREMYREGWLIIPNSQGADVTDAERKYCPLIGNQQVHLIAKEI